MGTRAISVEDVLTIKSMIWAGDKQWDIANKFEVSQGYISAIVNGRVYANIAWPDGTDGELSKEKRKSLKENRPGYCRAVAANPAIVEDMPNPADMVLDHYVWPRRDWDQCIDMIARMGMSKAFPDAETLMHRINITPFAKDVAQLILTGIDPPHKLLRESREDSEEAVENSNDTMPSLENLWNGIIGFIEKHMNKPDAMVRVNALKSIVRVREKDET